MLTNDDESRAAALCRREEKEGGLGQPDSVLSQSKTGTITVPDALPTIARWIYVIRIGVEMDKLREMEIFVAIVDRGSLTAASEKLGMSTPAVLRALNSLEARLGAQLLVRTPRAVRLTEAATSYLEACRRILVAVTAAEDCVTESFRKNPHLQSVDA
ncbi:LysR family transcriptional regulator [Cupriavidus sp. YR651]|uniref:LysR family transcriptional regulator n=1 Tax=Cupriavidus sp. YR651 TaxID=1855315 RepID=UPI002100D695|nr:LysR family transcriptional regulator [Cupriavidus sp. YR651]